jgi:SAM-dependent methyltransferase
MGRHIVPQERRMSAQQSVRFSLRLEVRLACPICRRQLDATLGAQLHHTHRCAACGFSLQCVDGIWHALAPDRAYYYDRFIHEYAAVRAADERGSDSPNYYRSLPFVPIEDTNGRQWQIRAISYQYLVDNVLGTLTKPCQRVLDLGAGNGWLSYRLALDGHRPVAVDLLTNDSDGLGAARHYIDVLPDMFPRVRAELDRLPFSDHQFDLAVFNASFHYSENYVRTLGEALRCVRRGGKVVILDTPWYESDSDGEQMVRERQAQFASRFGFPSDALESLEYVTPHRLATLEDHFHLRFQTLKPWYGFRWAARQWIARLKQRPTPSQFRIFVADAPSNERPR